MEADFNPEAVGNTPRELPIIPPVSGRRRAQRRADVLSTSAPAEAASEETSTADDPLASSAPTTTFQQTDAPGLANLLDILTRLRQYKINADNQFVNDSVTTDNAQLGSYISQLNASVQKQTAGIKWGSLIERLIKGLLGDMQNITSDVLFGEKVAGPWGALGGLLFGVGDFLMNFHYKPGEPSPMQDVLNWLYQAVDGPKWISKSNFEGLLGAVFQIGLGLLLNKVDPGSGQQFIEEGMTEAEKILKSIIASLEKQAESGENLDEEFAPTTPFWKRMERTNEEVARGEIPYLQQFPQVQRPIQG